MEDGRNGGGGIVRAFPSGAFPWGAFSLASAVNSKPTPKRLMGSPRGTPTQVGR